MLKKLFNLHITKHDKLDLTVLIVTTADCIWFLADRLETHSLYYVVGVLLLLGLLLSSKYTYELAKNHHKKHSKKYKHVIEEQVTKQSEK